MEGSVYEPQTSPDEVNWGASAPRHCAKHRMESTWRAPVPQAPSDCGGSTPPFFRGPYENLDVRRSSPLARAPAICVLTISRRRRQAARNPSCFSQQVVPLSRSVSASKAWAIDCHAGIMGAAELGGPAFPGHRRVPALQMEKPLTSDCTSALHPGRCGRQIASLLQHAGRKGDLAQGQSRG